MWIKKTKNNPDFGVIQSPDGALQYYTKSIDNRHNPYLCKSTDVSANRETSVDNNTEYADVVSNETIIIMPISDINNAVVLERQAGIVRFICIFDLIINIYIALSSYYMMLFSTIIATVSLMGYSSTITYNQKGLVLYLVYQYIQTIGKLMALTMYMLYSILPEYKTLLRNDGIELEQLDSSSLLIFTVVTFGQTYIVCVVHNFYNKLAPIV